MALQVQFPDPREAEDDGLVAVGGEINSDFLLAAYSAGLFPWYNPGEPVLWWSPNPRMILKPSDFKCSKSLNRTVRSGKFTIKMDENFSAVIQACAGNKRKGQHGTWIGNDIINGYTALHETGLAHSVETYYEDKLAGGLYGVSLGRVFFGESMFFLERDASKVALYYLCKKLAEWNFDFIDVQQSTDHLKSLGAKDISRDDFLNRLQLALKKPTRKGKWSFNHQ